MKIALNMVPDELGKVLMISGGHGWLDAMLDNEMIMSYRPNCSYSDGDLDKAFRKNDEALHLKDPECGVLINIYFPLSNLVPADLFYI